MDSREGGKKRGAEMASEEERCRDRRTMQEG
jgi:hypothetical protein